MKKTLLATAALLVAASGFAQTSQQTMSLSKNPLPRFNQKFERALASDAPVPVRRSASTGRFYSLPDGAFYRGYGLDGYGTYFSIASVPFTVPTTFVKQGTGSWKVGGEAVSATGNYVLTPSFSNSYIAPTLIQGRDSFALGSNNIYTKLYDQGNSQVVSALTSLGINIPLLHWGIASNDSIELLYKVDDHGSFDYQGSTYSNGATYGFLDTNYLFGSGKDVESDGTTYVSYQIEQYMGQATAPLYVESIVTEGRTTNQAGPLTNGATLTAYVTGVRTLTSQSGNTVYAADLNDILDTLTAEAQDTLDFKTIDTNGQQYGYGTFYEGKLLFTKKVSDEFGTSSSEPFIIPANKPFAIVIAGLDKAGVSYGIDGLRMTDDADANLQQGYIDVKEGDTEYAPAFTFSSRLYAKIGLVGMYDGAAAPAQPGIFTFEDENLNYNVIRVTGNGANTVDLTDGADGSVIDGEQYHGLPGAIVATSLPINDNEGNANYYLVGDDGTQESVPSWISGIQYEALDEDAHIYLFHFQVSALPAGTTGRVGSVYVASDKGAKSGAIQIVQGDATANAISSAKIDNVKLGNNDRIFNLAGQQVNKDYKGVVIKNGEKFIQK